MSSPDPLDEPTIIAVATTAAAAAASANSSLAPDPKTEPASRRVSHSQPHRSISPAASPRKHTLNLLQAGKPASSQRLSVAVQVQTEGHGDGGANDTMASTPGGTRRKLFKSPVQSPSTVRRRTDHAVTTTVPLRETGEDELTAAITPSRRRGRPRKSNGTPAPQAGVKRRAGSPISRNPRRVRTDRFGGGAGGGGGGGGGGGESTTQLHFDEGKENFHATPATAKRGRPPKAQAVQPSSELGATKRGRRRQAMAPDELVGIAEEAAAERSQVQSGRRVSESDAVDLIQPPPSRQGAQNDAAHGSDAASNADTESDWIPGPNNDATPRAAAQPSTLRLPSRSDHDHRAPEASDHSTVDEHINDYSSQTNDTIAQGEDFSMIFMDSIPSLQGSRNGNSSFQPAEDDDDVGDETHLIINNTLASLKREVAESSDPVEVTEQIEIPEEPEIEEQPEPEPEFVPIIRESARNARLSLSPWWSRKPKKMGTSGASPLRHQTLLRSAAKRSGRLFRFDHEREDEPTPTKAGKQPSSAQSRRDRSNDYRESFSEMPRNYLDTAAPKPLNFSATQDDRRVDLEEYGLHREDEHAEEEYAQEDHVQEDHAQEEHIGKHAEKHTEEHAQEHAEEYAEEHAEEERAEGAHAGVGHVEEEDAEEHVEEEHGEALAWHTEAPADDNLQESANNAPQQFFFATQPYSAVALGPMRIAMSEMSSPVRHIEDEDSEHREHGRYGDYGAYEYHGGNQDHEQGVLEEDGEQIDYKEPAEELEEQQMQEEPEEHGEHEGHGEHEKHEGYEEHEEYEEDEGLLQQEEFEEEEEGQREDMELDHEEKEREEEHPTHLGRQEEDMEEYDEEQKAEDHEQQGGEEDLDEQENHKEHEEALDYYAEQEGIEEHEEIERHEEHEDYVEEDGDFEEHEEPQQHGEDFNHRDEHDDHEEFGDHDDHEDSGNHDDHEDFEEHEEEVDQHDEHDQLEEHGEKVDQYEEHAQYGEEVDQHDKHDELEAHEAQDHEVQEDEEQEVEHDGLHDEHEDQEEVEDREHHEDREQQEHHEEREERKVRPYEFSNHRRPNFLARRQLDNKENHAEEQTHSVPPQQPEQPKPTPEREVRPYEFSNRWRPNFLARRRPETKGNHIDQDTHSRSSQGPEQLEPTPEREVQPVEATPPQQMSSPLQDPQSVPQDHVQYPVLRPVLSSIMRAGRVLQTVTSDPPSPREREKQLRSPFRSSASKEPSHSATEGSQPPPSKSPPQPFRFVRDQSAANGVTANQRRSAGSRLFGTGFGSTRPVLDTSAREPLNRNRPPSRESEASSLNDTPSRGATTDLFARTHPISSGFRGNKPLLQPSSYSGIRSLHQPLPLVQVDGAGEEPDRVDEEGEREEEDQYQVREDEDEREEAQMEEEEEEQQEQQEEEEQNEEEEDDDDDIDLWEYEAQREVPPRPVLQQPLMPMMPMTQEHNTAPGLESSRRDAQEAPAAVTAARALPNASRTNQTVGRQQLDRNVEDDESPQLSRKQPEQAPATASNPKRFDLSSFFSSPAALPGLLAEKFKSTKPKTSAQQIDQQAAAQQEESPTLPTTSLFPSLDQTVNGSRDFGRTAPASSSIPSDPPVEGQVVEDASSPATPEERGLPTIAQKQNFVPRPRQANDSSFFQPSSSQLSTSPTRMQLTHEDIQRWQLETSHAGDDSPSLKPLLRPLPPRHASPKKSNLRSPLKPHTPGRVVEFSGSVLSPEEQARLREQRLRANGDVSREDIGTAAAVPNHVQPRAGKGSMPRPQPQQQQQQQNQNRPSILAPRIIKPAGVTKKPPVKKHRRREPPSQTVWTRQHWIFLDTLLQMRRQRPFSERYAPVSQRYLGKVVTSMGESLVLEKWHLECVDAFKSQIKGWDEGELAKRLFALILGEAQRRRASLGQSSPGVMFH